MCMFTYVCIYVLVVSIHDYVNVHVRWYVHVVILREYDDDDLKCFGLQYMCMCTYVCMYMYVRVYVYVVSIHEYVLVDLQYFGLQSMCIFMYVCMYILSVHMNNSHYTYCQYS